MDEIVPVFARQARSERYNDCCSTEWRCDILERRLVDTQSRAVIFEFHQLVVRSFREKIPDIVANVGESLTFPARLHAEIKSGDVTRVNHKV
jgi:hypothetical protein